MQSPDIWSEIPYGQYTYPLDSLLNSPDSVQHAESIRMLRDLYLANVESSQGANQFIKFCRHCSENWLPSLFSTESLALKLILLLLLVISAIYLFVPSLKNKISNYSGLIRLTTVSLVLMLLAVPLGWDYFPTICLTILGIWLLIILIFNFARFSLKIKENWVWAVLVFITIITAILNISEPIPTFLKVKQNNNPVDNYFLVVCTAFLLFIALAFIHSWQKLYEFKKSKSYSEKLLLKREKLVSWALFSWCAAFLLYFIGIYYSGTQRSILTSLLRPAVSASKIFILADNPTDATLALRRSGLFMGLLSLARLSGFFVSAQIIIHLLGSRIRSFTRIRLAHCKDSSLYVFFNINSATIQVAKTITGAEGKKPHAVFVYTYEDNISKSRSTFGFGSFMSLFTHKKEAFDAISEANREELPTMLAISSSKLEDISDDCKSLESIGLKNVQRLINESSKTEFFFLSDDETANFAAAKKLTSLLDKNVKQKYMIYCNCRNNNLSQLLQFNEYRIETINFAKLAIDQLKNNPKSLLTDLVEFDDTGCCSSPLRSLVIGMNEIGEEVFNYLYEFGAFANRQKKRSDFECHVIDSKMHDLEGSLYMRIPQLRKRVEDSNANVSVDLLHIEVGSEEFWNWLDQHIPTLNFILITSRDEEEQLSLADEIYNLAVRRRPKDAPLPLRIFVCAYTANSANKLNLMAETYSSLNKYGNVELVTFGLSAKLFEYQYITKQDKISRAKQYYLSYQKTTENLSAAVPSWDLRRENALSRETNDPNTDKLASILELLRMEAQDISNEYHRSTKISIIKRALAKHTQRQYTMQDLLDVLPESLTHDVKAEHISDDKYLNTLFENLAVLEHLRWVASHELMGFQYEANVEKRLRSLLKKHSGMVDWSKLSNDIKLFDVAVVITSLMIEKDEQR